MRKILLLLLALVLFCAAPIRVTAQETGYAHKYSPVNGYIVPTDPLVLEKLDAWQDLKFGVLFHWGIYSVMGIMESWNLCSEDEEWEYKYRQETGLSYDEFKQWYWGLSRFFNPRQFDPDTWADVMKDAGMKYMVFTTKHHDGFCMFDTQYTDYKITAGPFADHPRSNVAKEVFDAFRAEDFWVGAYFSKPDWHCQWFWNPVLATARRGINYKKENHPDWWQNYVDFTMGQLTELTRDYGPMDLIWLDGGWISGKEVGLDEVLVGARERNPGMICVDRVSRDDNENYQTPECTVPPEQRNIPWETCDPLMDFSWRFNPNYKSVRRVVAELVEVVAKGGNLILGIAPTPYGTIDDLAQSRLHGIGEWLRKYGEAIYATRTTPVYHDGNLWFTASKDGRTLYAIYALADGESLPATVEWTGNVPAGKVQLVGDGRRLSCKVRDGKVSVTLPKGMMQESFALKFEMK